MQAAIRDLSKHVEMQRAAVAEVEKSQSEMRADFKLNFEAIQKKAM